MKKLLLILGLSLLMLTACEKTVVNSTPGDPAFEKVFVPKPFYIQDISVNEGDVHEGGYFLIADPVEWLSESEGTCINGADSVIQPNELPPAFCNPNGFLIVNDSTTDTLQYWISEETPIFVNNVIFTSHPKTKTVAGIDTMTVKELAMAFERSSDFFQFTPFEVEFGTITVGGIEMSDQIAAIKEIYIP